MVITLVFVLCCDNNKHNFLKVHVYTSIFFFTSPRSSGMSLVNSTNASKREISIFFNTLAGLAKNLEGYYTTVDLRNECCVTGKIVKIDAYMNIEMEDVKFYDTRGNEKSLLDFYVSAKNIRNIHMPKQKDAMTLLKDQLNCMTRKKEKVKRTFKTSRAERKNLATVAEAYQQKDN